MQIRPNLTLNAETRNSQPLKPKRNPSFKGAESFVVPTMDMIDNGGLAASFILQDFLGSIVPRTIMGGLRGKKENGGKTNKALALKEFLREVITGPSMFIVPGAILFSGKKFIGKALDVPADFIEALSDIYKNVPGKVLENATPKQLAKVKKGYYAEAFEKVLTETTSAGEEGIKKTAKEMAEKLYDATTSKVKPGFIKTMKGAPEKGSSKQLMGELSDMFVNFVKGSKHASQDPSINFLNGVLKKGEKEVVGSSFGKIVTHITNFTDDVVNHRIKNVNKDNIKDLPKIIEDFATKRKAGRLSINIIMGLAVTLFLTQVPKIYNRTKENPALIGLDDEVTKSMNAKEGKEVENAN